MVATLSVIFASILFIHCQCQHIFPNGTRNKYIWPFASDSIWNYPIGSNAEYVPSGINGSGHFYTDPDIWLVTSSNDPTVSWYNPYTWSQRCEIKNNYEYPYKVPLPTNFIIPDAQPPNTPNYCGAILLPDGANLLQLNPLCRDQAGGPIFGYASAENVNSNPPTFTSIYSTGYYGGHAGSGLSSIGGTLRAGELSPNNSYPIRGSIRHALKWELWGKMYYYRPPNITADPTGCRRWPADKCDGYWENPPSENGYDGKVNATRQGSLLAIRESDAEKLNDTLKTIPGRMILWTMVDFGAYIVDDSAWDSQQFCVEYGVEAQFEKDWGYSMVTGGPFAEDMILISKYFMVVNNNGPDNIGGGGSTKFPLPPKIGN